MTVTAIPTTTSMRTSVPNVLRFIYALGIVGSRAEASAFRAVRAVRALAAARTPVFGRRRSPAIVADARKPRLERLDRCKIALVDDLE